MATRAQLEQILAAQRAQRAHSPATRKRGRNLVGALAVIAILVASGAVMFFAVNMTTPKTDATVTASPSAFPLPSATSTTIMATPVAMLVVAVALGDGDAEGEAVAVAFVLGVVILTAKNIAAPLAIRINMTASAPTRFLPLFRVAGECAL